MTSSGEIQRPRLLPHLGTLHANVEVYVVGGQESGCHQLLVLSDGVVGRPLNEQLTLVSH